MTAGRIIVFGASGHGKVVAEIAQSLGMVVTAFADDACREEGRTLLGVPVLTWGSCAELPPPFRVALGVGDNDARQRIADRIRDAGHALETLVHGRATASGSASIGDGTVVMAGAVINAEARIGRGVVVNTGAIVEHDARIGDFVLIGPGTAMGGNVRIGAFTLVGVGARIKPGVSIGSRVTVGAGAVVTADVPDGATVIGVPARPVSRR